MPESRFHRDDEVGVRLADKSMVYGRLGDGPVTVGGHRSWVVHPYDATPPYMATEAQLDHHHRPDADRALSINHRGLPEREATRQSFLTPQELDEVSLKVLLSTIEDPCDGCRRIARVELERRIRAAQQDHPLAWHSHLDAKHPQRTREILAGTR